MIFNPKAFTVSYGSNTSGMDLRDYFAGKVVTGLVSGLRPGHDYSVQKLSSLAYQLADAMLAERSKAK